VIMATGLNADLSRDPISTYQSLSIVSYNMHGFHQGIAALQDLSEQGSAAPDIILVQEHWLTPANLHKFDDFFPDYFSFGCSAMTNRVQSGILFGRPYGGVMSLISNKLRKITETVCCSERYTVIRVANYLIVNVYLPCTGTPGRLLSYEDILAEIESWRIKYGMCECIIAGDLNCNLDSGDQAAFLVSRFIRSSSLTRCDHLFPSDIQATYINTQLSQQSFIDYILTSAPNSLLDFKILDPDINFSDHLPLCATFKLHDTANKSDRSPIDSANVRVHKRLRWDKGDRSSYYSYTSALDSLIATCDTVIDSFRGTVNCNTLTCDVKCQSFVDKIYDEVVRILNKAAQLFVPQKHKNFYKFWWSEELKIAKAASVESNNMWKALGKPHQGPIFEKRKRCRSVYRQLLRDEEKREKLSYSNDLHEALLKKNGKMFWNCWKAKFESSMPCSQVDGSVDDNVIINKFVDHFQKSYSCNNKSRADALHDQFIQLRCAYVGDGLSASHAFDTELVSKVVFDLHHGKAPDIVGLTGEHLQYCHPSVLVLLTKLFQLIILSGCVPNGFKHSYIVPVPKVKDTRTKALTCNDFRGIAISPIISKVFEYCVIDRFKEFFGSADNQFGFRKGSSCSHAIYSTRCIVDSIIKNGNTANLCSIDLASAFDKVNHHGLFLKLMKRHIPVELLTVLENWLSSCDACVKWNEVWSLCFEVKFGVRQGSVLSPYLFNIYLDDVARLNYCYKRTFIIIYADDILLIALTVSALESLLRACESELKFLDMSINVKKSCCIRIGHRHDITCASIMTCQGQPLQWVSEFRYLGVFIVSSRSFKCSLVYAKRSFYAAVNGLFGKLLNLASEEVILELVKSKCTPILLYGLECFQLGKADLHSLDFTFNRLCMKLFKTGSIDIVKDCQNYFAIDLPSCMLKKRQDKFIARYKSTVNNFCKCCINL